MNFDEAPKREAANTFVTTIKEKVEQYGLDNIFNSDQSGFQLELRSGRSLEFIGTKRVEKKSQSVTSLTHSYTIQPTITADGRLLSPLLVLLKEKDGVFPKTVKVFNENGNLHVLAGYYYFEAVT